MKKIFLIALTVLSIGNFAFFADAQSDSVVLLANKADYSHAWDLAGFIQKNEVKIVRAMPENFEKYKEAKHIVLITGPTSKDMETIYDKAFTTQEKDFLKIPGNKKMYYKEDIWSKDQKVIAFGFSNSEQVKSVLLENRSQWIEYLIEWFDLEISWEELEY